MDTKTKSIIVGLAAVVMAIGLSAGVAFGLPGSGPAGQQVTGATSSVGLDHGGMMGGGYGGMMGGYSSGYAGGMMGNHGLVNNGYNAFMGCIQYMAHFIGFGANGRTS
jgi:hypothetical protein